MITPEIMRKCREFIENRARQRMDLVMNLKTNLARDRRFEEVGRRLGELRPFIDYIYDNMMAQYESPSDFYNALGISRQVFSNMQQSNYDPSLSTVYKIIIGLKLNILDATVLMENAGYTFTWKTTTQLVIIFCIMNQIYDPMDVDDLLSNMGENVLFAA